LCQLQEEPGTVLPAPAVTGWRPSAAAATTTADATATATATA